MNVSLTPPELWCLAISNGKKCKETFETYGDFEEHFCQEHLELQLLACGGEGCNAQFGTLLQMLRHLAICKRKGKKIKLLKCPDAMERLATLDRAKILTTQCCVARAERKALRTIEANGTITNQQDYEEEEEQMNNGNTFSGGIIHSPKEEGEIGSNCASDEEEVHASITEESMISCHYQMQDDEPGPSYNRKERAVTPARQAARRLKEQMFLEEEMRKKNAAKVQQKKNAEDVQKKQKKLPVKITDKTRFSALITDDPSAPSKTAKTQIQEMDLYRDTTTSGVASSLKITKIATSQAQTGLARIHEKAFEKQSHGSVSASTSIVTVGSVNINTFSSTTARVSLPSGTKQPVAVGRTHEPVSVVQNRPRVFESSLPAGPNLPPKISDTSCRQRSASLGPEGHLSNGRPPDYSDFVNYAMTNPVHLPAEPARIPSPFLSTQSASTVQPVPLTSVIPKAPLTAPLFPQASLVAKAPSASTIPPAPSGALELNANQVPVLTSAVPQRRASLTEPQTGRSDNVSTSFLDVNVAPASDSNKQLRGILRKKPAATEDSTNSGQRELNILNVFSNSVRESKAQKRPFDRTIIGEIQSVQPPTKQETAIPAESKTQTGSATVPAESKASADLSRRTDSESSSSLVVLESGNNDQERSIDGDEDDDAPNLLNLFSDEQSNTYTLFDPRVKPEEKPSLFAQSTSAVVTETGSKGSPGLMNFHERKRTHNQVSVNHHQKILKDEFGSSSKRGHYKEHQRSEMSGGSHSHHGSSRSHKGERERHRYSSSRHRPRSRNYRSPRRSRSRSRSWSRNRSRSRSIHRSSSRRSSWGSRSRSGSSYS